MEQNKEDILTPEEEKFREAHKVGFCKTPEGIERMASFISRVIRRKSRAPSTMSASEILLIRE